MLILIEGVSIRVQKCLLGTAEPIEEIDETVFQFDVHQLKGFGARKASFYLIYGNLRFVTSLIYTYLYTDKVYPSLILFYLLLKKLKHFQASLYFCSV